MAHFQTISQDLSIGSRAASFKRPLLCVSACVSANLMLNISETKRFRGFVSNRDPTWKYGKLIVDVNNGVTWLYDIILMLSQSSKSSHLETRNRINYPCGIFIGEHCVQKSQLTRLTTPGEEAFGVTLAVSKSKLPIIGTVAVRWGRVCRLKFSSARANSSTGLFSLLFWVYTVTGKKRPPKHVKITLWIENVSDYYEKPSICNVRVKFHDN